MISIRGIEPSDWQVYKESRLRALRLAPTAYVSNYDDHVTYPDEFFKNRSTFRPTSFIFGAWDQADLVGTAGGYVEPETKRKHIAHIVGVWVDPGYRRRGIARDLTLAALAQIKALPQITLIQIAATATNHGAITLYESLGFKRYGIEPQSLKHDGVLYDEVMMALDVRDDESSL